MTSLVLYQTGFGNTKQRVINPHFTSPPPPPPPPPPRPRPRWRWPNRRSSKSSSEDHLNGTRHLRPRRTRQTRMVTVEHPKNPSRSVSADIPTPSFLSSPPLSSTSDSRTTPTTPSSPHPRPPSTRHPILPPLHLPHPPLLLPCPFPTPRPLSQTTRQ